MAGIWIAAALVAAGGEEGQTVAAKESPSRASTAATAEASPGREAARLRKLVSKRLREEATTRGGPRHEQAVRDLIDVYHRIQGDTPLSSGEQTRLTGSLRSRLGRVATRLRRAPRRASAAGAKGRQGEAGVGEALHDVVRKTVRPERWDDRGGPGVALLFQQPGGVPPAGRGGDGGRAAEDHGQELVELIEQTIAPNSWEVNGGPGSIVYFRNLRALVVRQTAEVHAGLGDVVEQLRRAGN